MATKNITVVLGTARAERASAAIAEAVASIVNEMEGYSATLVDVREHVKEAVTIPPWGKGGANETPTAWKEIVESSHALLLVVPEYNHSFPGELKLLLDSLWDEYRNKAVGLIGVSAGTLGAARVVDHIKPVLIELKLHPVKEAVHISKVKEALTAEGQFIQEKTPDYIRALVTEISQLSSALQTRETY